MRINVEEQHAEKRDRILRGRQFAHLIYHHFRATGAHDAAQGLSDLFNICSKSDDFQDFET